jgi:hypothetical protein
MPFFLAVYMRRDPFLQYAPEYQRGPFPWPSLGVSHGDLRASSARENDFVSDGGKSLAKDFA